MVKQRAAIRWISALGFVLLAVCSSAALAETTAESTPDPARAELQSTIESGADLGSRARKTLFRARNHQDEGRFGEAIEVLNDWLQDHPEREHPLLSFQLAIAQTGLQNREPALAALRAAVTKEPRFARAWLRLGEMAYDLELYSTAAEAFGQGYELSPVRRPEFWYYRCVSRLADEDAIGAVGDLERLLTDHRAGAPMDWYRALIAAAVEADQPERARPFVTNLLTDVGHDAATWELAYRFAVGSDDYESAAVYLTIAGYLRPLTATEWNQLGDLYAVIDVPLQAARCYAAAIDGSAVEVAEGGAAQLAQNQERIAGAWMAAHRFEEARSALGSALALRETRRLWALLGDLNYQDNDWAGALEAYTRATDLDPQFGRGWLMMGYCARELDRNAESREYLTRATEFPDQAVGARTLLSE